MTESGIPVPDFLRRRPPEVPAPPPPAAAPPAPPDFVREAITAKAQACLDHVRKVRWGEASAVYEQTDGDLSLLVTISVKSLGYAKPKDSVP